MPLNVEHQWSTTQILPAALKKQRDFNQNTMDDGEYVLLYPDGSQVQNIPGTDLLFWSIIKRPLGNPTKGLRCTSAFFRI